jgi:hypothetical protein
MVRPTPCLGEKYTGFPSIWASAGLANRPRSATIADNLACFAVILSSSKR